jgi:hypothetical protein
MKAGLLLLAVLFLSVAAVHADTYVKQHAHTDEYYFGGQVSPALDSENEFWLGNNKMIFATEKRIIIVDKNENKLIFANKSDSTFVETALPLDWMKFVPEDFAGRLKMFETVGTVEKTNETRVIEGFNCTAYKINAYIPYQGTKYNEQDITLWVTADLPQAAKTYGAIAPDILKLRNYKEDLIAELLKIEGFQILEETMNYQQGMSYTSTETAVEVSEKEPPAGVYALPKWYKKKELLSREDLSDD